MLILQLNESGALVVSLNKQIESLRGVNETQRLSLNNLTSVNHNLEVLLFLCYFIVLIYRYCDAVASVLVYCLEA